MIPEQGSNTFWLKLQGAVTLGLGLEEAHGFPWGNGGGRSSSPSWGSTTHPACVRTRGLWQGHGDQTSAGLIDFAEDFALYLIKRQCGGDIAASLESKWHSKTYFVFFKILTLLLFPKKKEYVHYKNKSTHVSKYRKMPFLHWVSIFTTGLHRGTQTKV